tara:strand:- start:1642 stop:4620 length:2979 start_codon:yes stop_codon:yes gene_type:complete
MLKQYFEWVHKYNNLLGKNTVVLVEFGKFFEIYSKEEPPIFLKKICDDINLVLTKKSKNKDHTDIDKYPYMAGINKLTIDKYLEKLQNKNYNIVLAKEMTPSPNIVREVVEIITPGTKLNISNSTSNFLMCIYVTYETLNFSNEYCYYGVSVIEITTGKIYLYEDKDVYNFIQNYKPNEIIIYNLGLSSSENIINEFDLNRIHYKSYDKINNKMTNINYTNEFLNKIYKNTGSLSPIEYLDLEFMRHGTISLILLLEYVNSLTPSLILHLDKPLIWNNNNILELRNNTLFQLNILKNDSLISNFKINCLIDVIDNTSTAVGKREFKNKILNPILDVNKLDMIYDYVDELRDNYKTLENELNNILDIERFHRKLTLALIKPNEFGKLNDSYKSIINLLKLIETSDIFENDIEKLIDFMNSFYTDFITVYNVENLKKYNQYNFYDNIFNEGINLEIDNVINTINELKNEFKKIREDLTKLCIVKDKGFYIKFEYSVKYGYILELTEKRSKLVKKEILKLKEYSNIIFEKKNSQVLITSGELKKNSNKIIVLEEKIQNLIRLKFKESIKKYNTNYHIDNFRLLNKVIANIDIYKSYAKTSILNNYCKPIIQNKFDNKSYLKLYDLRHPIIEKINNDFEYIPNDIELSGDKEDGILLFGPNATGKSSVMKSIGICIILAQIGMFVPCSRMIYFPYKKIFSRIIGNDNLFKAQSSFAVEMIEVKQILDNAYDNALILGDEICRGTEDLSAISLVASLIKELSERKSSLIFTTHLHKLPTLDIIKDLNNIKSYHLTIDIKDDKIIYLRKMKEGSGGDIYGLEIARNIVDNNNFIQTALIIRNSLLNRSGKILDTKSSVYNTDVLIDKCQIPECELNGVDSHHIKFQKDADSNNFIGHIHKNDKSNLIVLCKEHHNDVHNNKLVIKGYIETSNGKELDYYFQNLVKNKKYSEAQVILIKEYLDKNKIKKINNFIINDIRKTLNNNISKPTLLKILNNTY